MVVIVRAGNSRWRKFLEMIAQVWRSVNHHIATVELLSWWAIAGILSCWEDADDYFDYVEMIMMMTTLSTMMMMMMIDKHNSCKIHQQPRQLLSHSLFGGELTLKWWWWWRSWRWGWWRCWSWWSSQWSHSLVLILATWKAQQWHQDSVNESEVWILSFWLVWSHIACSDYDGCCVNHHNVDFEAWSQKQ